MTAVELAPVVPDVPGVYPWQDRETPVLPGEVWKTHPERIHLSVSTLGRVRNRKTGNFLGYNGGGGFNRNGARRTTVYRRVTDPAGGNVNVHTLVLETFVGPRPDGYEGDHIDHDPLNNCLSNLQWRLVGDNRADNRPSR